MSKVKEAAAENLKAIDIIKEMADALIQSCNHFKTTQVASAAALEAERAFAQKEAVRLEKLRVKEQERLKKVKDKEAQKKDKKERKRLEKEKIREEREKEDADAAEAAAADQEDGQDGGGEGAVRVRRGKGLNELGADDPPVIRDKVPGCEARIVTTVEDFLSGMARDEPTIFRLSRSALKKIMEIHSESTGANHKEINAVNNVIKTELENFLSDFAERCEAGPGRAGHCKSLHSDSVSQSLPPPPPFFVKHPSSIPSNLFWRPFTMPHEHAMQCRRRSFLCQVGWSTEQLTSTTTVTDSLSTSTSTST